jgi:hypothetical protein
VGTTELYNMLQMFLRLRHLTQMEGRLLCCMWMISYFLDHNTRLSTTCVVDQLLSEGCRVLALCCYIALGQPFLRPQRKIRKEHGIYPFQNLLLWLQRVPKNIQISSGEHDVEVRHVLSVSHKT